MKLFYKEIARLILKLATVSYFKLYSGWVKKSKKRKITYFYSTKKVISVLHCHYHSIFLEISEHDHYGRPLFPHHAPKVVHSTCHWPLSGDVGTAFVVTLKTK